MTQLLTFLGKGGTGKTTAAIATAKAAARQGMRTLVLAQDGSPGFAALLGVKVTGTPQTIDTNLSAVQIQGTTLMNEAWAFIDELEKEYVTTPFFKDIYPQEVPILPGQDNALALLTLRSFFSSGDYDVLVYDSPGNMVTLRTLGTPEVGAWYQRRASKAFLESDLYKALRPFADPLIQAVSPGAPSLENLVSQMRGRGVDLMDEGRQVIADPAQLRAYLVTTSDAAAVATAKYLWGSAQMVGLTVAGVVMTPHGAGSQATDEFTGIPQYGMASWDGQDWGPLVTAAAPLLTSTEVPPPVAIDRGAKTMKLFIPGFAKEDIQLSQSGPELTVTAGDQRRNLFLPAGFEGLRVTGAKFTEPYLTISLG